MDLKSLKKQALKRLKGKISETELKEKIKENVTKGYFTQEEAEAIENELYFAQEQTEEQ